MKFNSLILLPLAILLAGSQCSIDLTDEPTSGMMAGDGDKIMRPWYMGRSISDEFDVDEEMDGAAISRSRIPIKKIVINKPFIEKVKSPKDDLEEPMIPNESAENRIPAIIAATIAVTLLVSFLGYFVIKAIYESMNGSGHGYISVDSDSLLPRTNKPNTGTAGATHKKAAETLDKSSKGIKDTINKGIAKGKEKLEEVSKKAGEVTKKTVG